jgi:acetylornithine/N-succinyldiaminopimelate aminotransferase
MVNRLQSLGMLVPPAGENVIRVFPALIADKARSTRASTS